MYEIVMATLADGSVMPIYMLTPAAATVLQIAGAIALSFLLALACAKFFTWARKSWNEGKKRAEAT